MLEITPAHYTILSAALFSIGVIGVLVRRNIIIVFMAIELMLNAVNINLVAYAQPSGRWSGGSSLRWLGRKPR